MVACLRETPVPFDKWMRVVRRKEEEREEEGKEGKEGKGKNALIVMPAGGGKDDEIGEEGKKRKGSGDSELHIQWDQWIPAGSDEMYHFLRCVAQCPHRTFGAAAE